MALVIQPVALATLLSTCLWRSSLSRMAVAITVSLSSPPQSAKPLFEVSMMLPRSSLSDTRLKNAVADSLSQLRIQIPSRCHHYGVPILAYPETKGAPRLHLGRP